MFKRLSLLLGCSSAGMPREVQLQTSPSTAVAISRQLRPVVGEATLPALFVGGSVTDKRDQRARSQLRCRVCGGGEGSRHDTLDIARELQDRDVVPDDLGSSMRSRDQS